jgi:hypothetical protein
MTKATLNSAKEFKSLRTKLEFPEWVFPPRSFPCVFVWTWVRDNDVFQCEYIFPDDFKAGETRAVKLQRIIEVVSEACCYDASVVTGKSQHRTFSDARAIICHEARKRAYTFKEIGAALNRTHKSVYEMQERYSSLKKYHPAFDKLASKCEHALDVAFL